MSIAYQVMGEGPDLVCVPGGISHLDLDLELAKPRRFYSRLAAAFRLVRFDKPNTGLSDRDTRAASLDDRIDDLKALLEAVDAKRPALLGVSAGGAISILFAAMFPERIAALVLCGATAYWGDQPQVAALRELADHHWGQGGFISYIDPALASVAVAQESVARYERSAASPAAARAVFDEGARFDARPLLRGLRVPTLVLHSIGDRLSDVTLGRYLATHIPEARYIEVDSACHFPWQDDPEAVADEICAFIRTAPTVEPDTAVVTVLAVESGGAVDPERFARDVDRVRGLVLASRGTTLLATFDSPRRAARCALALCWAAPAGAQARAGLHTGEVVVRCSDPGGPTVEAAVELAQASVPGEVLATTMVGELLAGSGIELVPWGPVRERIALRVVGPEAD